MNRGILPPLIEEELYVDGLFDGFQIYTDGVIKHVTRPYKSVEHYTDPTFKYTSEEIEFFQKIEEKYNELRSDTSIIHLSLKEEPLIRLNYEKFKYLKEGKVLYLQIRKALNVDNTSYIEFDFMKFLEGPFKDEIKLYITVEEGEVVGWFFK